MTEKTIAAKLQIKPDYSVYFAGLPDAEGLVGELPAGAHTVATLAGADAAVLFVADSAELELALTKHLGPLADATAAWLCYPKGNKADINRDTIWTTLAAFNWRLVSNVSIDATWSALRAKPESA